MGERRQLDLHVTTARRDRTFEAFEVDWLECFEPEPDDLVERRVTVEHSNTTADARDDDVSSTLEDMTDIGGERGLGSLDATSER